MGHDIFISYSSKDKAVADAVVATLENQGIRCWYAPRDIRAGMDWGESITQAISDCGFMLLIFSKNSNKSQRVLDEIYFAISEGKTLLPFRIENLDPSGAMRLHLSSRHWLDAYDPSWKQHLNELADAATAVLKREEASAGKEPDRPARPRKKPRRKRGWVPVAVILAIAVVAVGAYVVLNMGDGAFPLALPPAATSDSPTETLPPDVPTETVSLPTPSATAIPSRPTSTSSPPTPEPTESLFVEGSVKRANYDPAVTMGDPDIYEDFEGADGFFTTYNGVYRSWYQDGLFNITYSSRGWWGWSLGDYPVPDEFYVDVVVMHTETCVEQDTAGLVVRYHEGSRFGMLAGISCTGKYWFGFSSGSDFPGSICSVVGSTLSLGGDEDCSGLPVFVESEHIASGPGAVNRIGLLGRDAVYTLYINGHEVATVVDAYSPGLPSSTLPNPYSGYVGLFLGAGQEDLSQVAFDDFSMWRKP